MYTYLLATLSQVSVGPEFPTALQNWTTAFKDQKTLEKTLSYWQKEDC